MSFTTLITPDELAANLDNPDWVVIDCRFVLTDVNQGRLDYEAGHIAGAVYAHLDDDLSGPIIPGKTGRHPLPAVGAFAETLSRWGVDAATQVVSYDAMGGAIASRLWWMLRWLGHSSVAVLDGGWSGWQKAAGPIQSGIETRPARQFSPRLWADLAVDAEAVSSLRNDSAYCLVDSRSADRYRGENESLDPVGGHIPGAVSLPFGGNLAGDGTFLPAADLEARFRARLGDSPAENIVFYCGSGVTAAHNVLAMAHAGLGDARLYPGSWSEWITDPDRPVATGDA